MFGNLSDYTTDELIALRSHVQPTLGLESKTNTLAQVVDYELGHRRAIRNAWLDHCNAVAGEIIA